MPSSSSVSGPLYGQRPAPPTGRPDIGWPDIGWPGAGDPAYMAPVSRSPLLSRCQEPPLRRIVELAATEQGAGSPVLVLHGLFGSARNWATIARRLAERHRVFALDLRNHGASPW